MVEVCCADVNMQRRDTSEQCVSEMLEWSVVWMVPLTVMVVLAVMSVGIMLDSMGERPRYTIRRQLPLVRAPREDDNTTINRVVEPDTTSQSYPKWLDVFHVSHEEAVWRMRFEEHWDVVDEFHVFESEYTQQGTKKRLYFANRNVSLFSKYESKIHYHIIEPPLDVNDCVAGGWTCEKHDREAITKVMRPIVQQDDCVILSDADEIVSLQTLLNIQRNHTLPLRVETPSWKYSFHWKQRDKHISILIAKGSWLSSIDWVNWRTTHVEDVYYNGGWETSTFGSIVQIMIKTKSIIEGVVRQHSEEETVRRVQHGLSLWNAHVQFEYSDTLENVPQLAHTDASYFEKHFMRYKKSGP